MKNPAEQRKKDLAYFRAKWPHVGAHGIPDWFAEGAAYGRANPDLEQLLADIVAADDAVIAASQYDNMDQRGALRDAINRARGVIK